jgi:hypothetical protein
MGQSRFDHLEAEFFGDSWLTILSDRYKRTMAQIVWLAIISREPNLFSALVNWQACSVVDKKRLAAKLVSNAFATRLDRRELQLPWAHLSMFQIDVAIKRPRSLGSVGVC